MLVAVVTNKTGDTILNRLDRHAEEQATITCEAVVNSLTALGHGTAVVEVGPTMLRDLENIKPDVIFNIATGYRSKKDQANIVAALELLGLPMTGSASETHVMGLYKHLTKCVMQMSGIPTPGFIVVGADKNIPAVESLEKLDTPLIVKPGAEGSSVGISEHSVIHDLKEVHSLVEDLMTRYGPPVLIEEYITGREFTVALLGYPEPKALPVQEIIFNQGNMYTYSVKSKDNVTPVCPADIPPQLAVKLQTMAKRIFKALNCRDLARVDIRLSLEGLPYLLEVNTLPGLMPKYSEFPRIAEIAGFDYDALIEHILEGALSRSID